MSHKVDESGPLLRRNPPRFNSQKQSPPISDHQLSPSGSGWSQSNRIHTGLGKPGKSWNLRISFSRPEKSWNYVFGHQKSWQIKVLFDRSVTADDKARTM